MTTCTRESGTCDVCRRACSYKPGWFLPGEAERVADYLDMSLTDLFRTKLAVDWWDSDEQLDHDVFVLSPAVVGGQPGEEFPANPKGRCVFFVDERCSIHPVRPFECSEYLCSDTAAKVTGRHLGVATEWDTAEAHAQIVELLGGYEPTATYYDERSWLW